MQTHTRYSNETRENLDHYLSKAGIHMYAKNAGSSEGAVWETPEYTATLRLTDLTRTNPIDYALFEYYPGIMVRVSKSDKDNIDIPCYKNVAAYCAEFIKPTYGAMEVSREHRDVYFKFELPVKENALSESTIAALERRAAEVISQHRENLMFLANTHIPYKKFRKLIQNDKSIVNLVDDDHTDETVNADMFLASLDSIRAHLEKHSNHNIVAESVDEAGNPTWKCEIFTGRDHYFLDLSADQRSGMLVLRAMDGPKSIPVDADARREVAAYLAGTSSIRKVGYLWSGNDTEGMCCVTNASMVDGVIGGETIELIEGLMLKSLYDIRSKACALAFGEEADEDDDIGSPSRFDMLRKMLGNDDDDCDDNDSDDDDTPKMPFMGGHMPNFSSMMADVLARVKGSRDGQAIDAPSAMPDVNDEPDDGDADDESDGSFMDSFESCEPDSSCAEGA